jgi:hypothetical protein
MGVKQPACAATVARRLHKWRRLIRPQSIVRQTDRTSFVQFLQNKGGA